MVVSLLCRASPVQHLLIEDGYLVPAVGARVFVGTSWSLLQPVIDGHLPDLGPLPGNIADDQTMRFLDLLCWEIMSPMCRCRSLPACTFESLAL